MKPKTVFGVIIGFIPIVYSIYILTIIQTWPITMPVSLFPSLFLDIIGLLIIDLALEDKIKNYIKKKLRLDFF